MPRQPRMQSESGVAHVITRGIGRRLLFEEPADHLRYLATLERFSHETDVSILAYCLMENHVHLLTKSTSGELPLMMKKIGVS